MDHYFPPCSNKRATCYHQATLAACVLLFGVPTLSAAPQLLKQFEGGVGKSQMTPGLVAADGILYFPAEDGENEGENFSLWRTDGTPQGTVLVKNIEPYGYYRSNMAALGAHLFFFVEGTNGYQLWRSDGSAAGTLLLHETPSVDWPLAPHSLTSVDTNYIYFAAYSGLHGMELWRTHGSATSATLVSDIFPGEDAHGEKNSASPENLTAAGSSLFFAASTPDVGRELWQVDPRGAIGRVKDIYPGEGFGGPHESNPSNIIFAGYEDVSLMEYIVFSAKSSLGEELWRSDGTEAGTFMVEDIETGMGGSSPSQITRSRDRTFFVAKKAGLGRELWVTSEPGVSLVKDIYPGDPFGAPAPTELTDVRGTLFFVADDGTHGAEIWRSDGTPEGTYMIKDIVPGSSGSRPFNLTHHNGMLYFGAYEGGSSAFWQSDGTASGTMRVSDAYPDHAFYFSAPSEMAVMGGDLYAVIGNTLWKIPGETVVSSLPFTPQQRAGDWAWVPWLGWYTDTLAPWIWHIDHGWLYLPPGDEAGFWSFDLHLGWFYTSSGSYPWFFQLNGARWLYYQMGTSAPRWFSHGADWFTVSGAGG